MYSCTSAKELQSGILRQWRRETQSQRWDRLSRNHHSTLTNVNFDKKRFADQIDRATTIRDALPAAGNPEPEACTRKPKSESNILEKATTVGTLSTVNKDARSLHMTVVEGLKGIAAYNTHAEVLRKTDTGIEKFLQKGPASTLPDLTVPEMVALVLECGSTGVKTLALLDGVNTSSYAIRRSPALKPLSPPARISCSPVMI